MNENVPQKIMPALPAPLCFAAVATPSASLDRKARANPAVSEELAFALEHLTAIVGIDEPEPTRRGSPDAYVASWSLSVTVLSH